MVAYAPDGSPLTVPVQTLSTVVDLVMVNGVASRSPVSEAMPLESLQMAVTIKVSTPMTVSFVGLTKYSVGGTMSPMVGSYLI